MTNECCEGFAGISAKTTSNIFSEYSSVDGLFWVYGAGGFFSAALLGYLSLGILGMTIGAIGGLAIGLSLKKIISYVKNGL